MALIGLSLVVASVVLFCLRPRAWWPNLFANLTQRRIDPPAATPPIQQAPEPDDNESSPRTVEQPKAEDDPVTTRVLPPSIVTQEPEEEPEDEFAVQIHVTDTDADTDANAQLQQDEADFRTNNAVNEPDTDREETHAHHKDEAIPSDPIQEKTHADDVHDNHIPQVLVSDDNQSTLQAERIQEEQLSESDSIHAGRKEEVVLPDEKEDNIPVVHIREEPNIETDEVYAAHDPELESSQKTEAQEEDDDEEEQSTPKATATIRDDPVPTLVLPDISQPAESLDDIATEQPTPLSCTIAPPPAFNIEPPAVTTPPPPMFNIEPPSVAPAEPIAQQTQDDAPQPIQQPPLQPILIEPEQTSPITPRAIPQLNFSPTPSPATAPAPAPAPSQSMPPPPLPKPKSKRMSGIPRRVPSNPTLHATPSPSRIPSPPGNRIPTLNGRIPSLSSPGARSSSPNNLGGGRISSLSNGGTSSPTGSRISSLSNGGTSSPTGSRIPSLSNGGSSSPTGSRIPSLSNGGSSSPMTGGRIPTLAGARSSSPTPNRSLPIPNRRGASTAGAGLMPPPTAKSIPKKPSRQVTLQPGHSPLDWARLAQSPTSDLRGLPADTPYLRVTPSMLKQQNGRKGRDAWSVFGGKVYNISPYIAFHPGGGPELLRGAGKDGTRLFMEVHPWVNWETMLQSCLVGLAVEEGEVEGAMEAMD